MSDEHLNSASYPQQELELQDCEKRVARYRYCTTSTQPPMLSGNVNQRSYSCDSVDNKRLFG